MSTSISVNEAVDRLAQLSGSTVTIRGILNIEFENAALLHYPKAERRSLSSAIRDQSSLWLTTHDAITPNDGDRVMVVDSGGGTTDITIATLRISDGAVESIEDPRTESVTLADLRNRGKIEGSQFGGGDVTRLAASHTLCRWATEREIPEVALISRLSTIAHRSMIDVLDTRCAIPSGSISSVSLFASKDPGTYWHMAVPELAGRAELCKRGLVASAKTGDFRPQFFFTDDHKDVSITFQDFTLAQREINTEYAERLNDVLRDDLKHSGVHVKWVVYVGGNSMLSGMRCALNDSAIRSVEISDTLRREAIALGLLADPPIPFYDLPVRVVVLLYML